MKKPAWLVADDQTYEECIASSWMTLEQKQILRQFPLRGRFKLLQETTNGDIYLKPPKNSDWAKLFSIISIEKDGAMEVLVVPID